MKQNTLKIISVIVTMLFARTTYAIDDVGNFDVYLNNSTSAEVHNMIRYGEVETSLFTGTLNFSIPIYSLKDPDFNLDIILRYNSDGFKPMKHSGWVGYNWYLQTGGCITREVRNIPDEAKRHIGNNFSGHFSYSKGMYLFTQETNYNKEDIYMQNPDVFCYCTGNQVMNVGNNCSYDVDYMPDIYHFNFLGYNGSFMINNKGDIQIISGDYVKVDLSETIDENVTGASGQRPKPLDTSQITIKTNDGYTYIFGGAISALEFSYALNGHNSGINQTSPTISTWHLSKVIAPNGRSMTYYYKAGGNEGAEWPINNDRLMVFNQYYDMFAPGCWWCLLDFNDMIHSLDYYTNYMNTNNLKFSITKDCILDSILISGEHPVRINFDNTSLKKQLYASGAINSAVNNYMLETIQVISNNQIIRNASLTYESKSDNAQHYYWQFLDRISISGEGEYVFKYDNNLYNFPNLYMVYDREYYDLVDLYGYWRTTPFKGLLSEVHFPTGGYQKYTYSKHDYSIERRYHKLLNNHIELYSKETGTLPISGVRIQQIKTYDTNNTLIEQRIFNYRMPGNIYTSSGVFYNNMAVYSITEDTCSFIQTSNSYSFFDTHIGYSNVEESVRDGNNAELYKTAYTFDTGLEYFSSGNNSINQPQLDSIDYSAFTGLLTYDENLFSKGKLLSSKYYKTGNELVKSVERIYNNVSGSNANQLGSVDTIVLFSHYWEAPLTRKLFIYPDVLTKEITKEYSDGDSLITTRTYSYDRKLRVTKETIDDSRGIQHFTKYTYPDNLTFNIGMIPYSHYPSIYLLKLKHQINNPIEVFSGYLGEDSIEYVTSGKINLYATGMFLSLIDNNPSSPAHIPPFIEIGDSINLHIYDSIANPIFEHNYYPYLHKTLFLPISSPLLDYQPIVASGTTLIYDSYYKTEAEFKFDHMGRLLSHKPLGGIETKYTWNGIYPATKTIGDMTWTYTHIPHVGVQSITDPRGITTYYDYDEQGRLVKEYQIINNKEQILNVYQYHVKTE